MKQKFIRMGTGHARTLIDGRVIEDRHGRPPSRWQRLLCYAGRHRGHWGECCWTLSPRLWAIMHAEPDDGWCAR